jgi:hypothetical protein
MGVIFGHTPRSLRVWKKTSEVMLLTQDEGIPLSIQEFANIEFNVTTAGHAIAEQPDPDSPPNFEVSAGAPFSNNGLDASFDNDECHIFVTVGYTELAIDCDGTPEPYGPGFESPEGSFFSQFPLGLHWYVYSMRIPVKYTFKYLLGSQYYGKGWMHAEKNWGESFPDGWIWAQGFDRNSSFVLAGGVPPSPLVPSGFGPEIYLASVHVGDRLIWRFHPWDPTSTSVQIKACGDAEDPEPFATLRFNTVQPLESREVKIFIKASLKSFSELNCPTKHGFTPSSDHSYSGVGTIKLYTITEECHSWFRCKKERKLIHSVVIQEVALEFGGNKRCGYTNKNAQREAVK